MLSLSAVLCYALHDSEKRQSSILTSHPLSRILQTESLRVEVGALSSH